MYVTMSITKNHPTTKALSFHHGSYQ